MKSQIITRTDPDGRHVVGVPLSNAPGKTAWLYREDFERVTALYPGPWSLVDARQRHSYVRVRKGGSTVYVSRQVAEAPKGSSVRYRDDDTLNLRLSNLSVATGITPPLSSGPVGRFDHLKIGAVARD